MLDLDDPLVQVRGLCRAAVCHFRADPRSHIRNMLRRRHPLHPLPPLCAPRAPLGRRRQSARSLFVSLLIRPRQIAALVSMLVLLVQMIAVFVIPRTPSSRVPTLPSDPI